MQQRERRMIQFEDVSKVYYGNKTALQGLSFHLPKHSITYLMGHSGAGKSTLLKLIMAMERANTGKIFFNGLDISRLSRREIPFLRRQIGMVHQEDQLLNEFSVLHNVALPLIIQGISPNEANQKAQEALMKVALDGYENARPKSLSGGEQQRVGIARAIVHQPQILLADEPTGNLDNPLAKGIFKLFEYLNQQEGMTILIATHNIEVAKQCPHQTLTLQQGRLV